MEKLVSEISIKSGHVRALLRRLNKSYFEHPILLEIENSLNRNQITNKEWLVDLLSQYSEMITYHPNILVLAGWYGLAGHMIANKIPCQVTVIDKNPDCAIIGKELYPYLKHVTADLNDFNMSGYNIIICTACEHITDDEINTVLDKKDKSTVVFLQSNNYNEVKDHINCKTSVDDFANSLQLSSCKKYTLSLDKYERFMVIGK
tara:strand:- start:1147 stop:1758 length:612 start_codon:yes stop_codon:yes gene_type:complete